MSLTQTARRSGALAAAILCVTGAVSPAAPAANPVPVRVRVDVSRPQAASSQVGFLNGLNDVQPNQRWVTPLAPTLWRGSPLSAPWPRVDAMGAQFILVLSDLWGYPRYGAGWRGAPWRDMERWRAFVRHVVRATSGQPVIWDIWNEPDAPASWEGSWRDYLETYLVAYQELEAAFGPDVRVTGPSLARFEPWRVRSLLEFCAQRGCRVPDLGWHEIPGESSEVGRIADHLLAARRLADEPGLGAAGARRLYITEYPGQRDAFLPGELVSYWSQLEHGGAAGAVRACWRDPNGIDTCAAPSLGGLLDPLTGAPRATWWATEWYAEGVGTRVRSSSSRRAVAALASADRRRRQAVVLLGLADLHAGRPPRPARVTLALRGLGRLLAGSGRSLVVQVERLPAQARHPAGPSTVETSVVQVHSGAVRLRLRTPLGVHEALRVRVFAAP